MSPRSVRLAARPEPPVSRMSLPGWFFRAPISSARFSLMIRVFQSGSFSPIRVYKREKLQGAPEFVQE